MAEFKCFTCSATVHRSMASRIVTARAELSRSEFILCVTCGQVFYDWCLATVNYQPDNTPFSMEIDGLAITIGFGRHWGLYFSKEQVKSVEAYLLDASYPK